jgi:hypothetical protein
MATSFLLERWAVRKGSERLDLFITQLQALNDVEKRRDKLKAIGRDSSFRDRRRRKPPMADLHDPSGLAGDLSAPELPGPPALPCEVINHAQGTIVATFTHPCGHRPRPISTSAHRRRTNSNLVGGTG